YSGGTIDTDKQIRRIQYPSYEYTSNADAVNAAVSSLGGPDLGSTSVWWDTNKGNPNPVNF
ncbi:MAG: SusD/RagB family nutrient-binding outer membrane lipoprotein, partial [Chitinophagaceae bacterium]|nr:SusD/RagB family nutrient-binding outer membrane lipoprotein [Chitinophagaceae bacterium]